MKKVIAIILTICMLLIVPIAAYAESGTTISLWHNIVEITGNSCFFAGLRSDGKIELAKLVDGWRDVWWENHPWELFQSEVSAWENVRSITTGGTALAAILADGSVRLATLKDGAVSISHPNWANIIDVKTNGYQTIGLHADGSAELFVDSDTYLLLAEDLERIVPELSNVKAVILGENDFWGNYYDFAFFDGSLYSERDRNNRSGRFKAESFTDFAKSAYLTVGIKEDGTVTFWGIDEDAVEDAADWSDIIQVICGDTLLLGVKKDGTVVSAGYTERIDSAVECLRDVKKLFLTENGNNIAALHSDASVTIPFWDYQDDFDEEGQLEFITLFNIKTCEMEQDYCLALKNDGTVIVCLYPRYYGIDIVADSIEGAEKRQKTNANKASDTTIVNGTSNNNKPEMSFEKRGIKSSQNFERTKVACKQ